MTSKSKRDGRRTFLSACAAFGAALLLPLELFAARPRRPPEPRLPMDEAPARTQVSVRFVAGVTPTTACRITLERPALPTLELFAYRPASASPATLPVRIVVAADRAAELCVTQAERVSRRPLALGVHAVALAGGARALITVEAAAVALGKSNC